MVETATPDPRPPPSPFSPTLPGAPPPSPLPPTLPGAPTPARPGGPRPPLPRPPSPTLLPARPGGPRAPRPGPARTSPSLTAIRHPPAAHRPQVRQPVPHPHGPGRCAPPLRPARRRLRPPRSLSGRAASARWSPAPRRALPPPSPRAGAATATAPARSAHARPRRAGPTQPAGTFAVRPRPEGRGRAGPRGKAGPAWRETGGAEPGGAGPEGRSGPAGARGGAWGPTELYTRCVFSGSTRCGFRPFLICFFVSVLSHSFIFKDREHFGEQFSQAVEEGWAQLWTHAPWRGSLLQDAHRGCTWRWRNTTLGGVGR